jgi:nitroimidazol reductase NimA-like FMN-containing flavoprotein (pyridoxamine 5'-phosphate oxidase superfamily)
VIDVNADRKMRRRDKQVTDAGWIEGILRTGSVVYLGLASPDGDPYVVPVGYGYEDGVIYLHGAKDGMKNDLIAANPRVSFNVSLGVELALNDPGSNSSMKYRSVTGFGDVREITSLAGKNAALRVLMRQYGGSHADLTEADVNSVWVARIDIRSTTGKVSGYPK